MKENKNVVDFAASHNVGADRIEIQLQEAGNLQGTSPSKRNDKFLSFWQILSF